MNEILVAVLLHLTSPDGLRIDVNPNEIVLLRPPRESDKRLIGPNVNCMIFTGDGKYVATVETCEEIGKKIN